MGIDLCPDASADEALLASIRTGRGWIPNVFRVMLHSPTVTAGWVALANALRSSSLDLRTRELAILLVAHVERSEYEWGHHEGVGRSAGLSDAELAALRDWPDEGSWGARDRAVLTVADAVVRNQPVPDRCLAELEDDGPGFVVELVATTAYYLAVARFTAALDVPVDDHDAGPGSDPTAHER